MALSVSVGTPLSPKSELDVRCSASAPSPEETQDESAAAGNQKEPLEGDFVGFWGEFSVGARTHGRTYTGIGYAYMQIRALSSPPSFGRFNVVFSLLCPVSAVC